MTRDHHRYTPEDDALLIAAYPHHAAHRDLATLAERMHRSVRGLKRRADILGLRAVHKPWTAPEDAVLRRDYERLRRAQRLRPLAADLHRTPAAIYTRARWLGLVTARVHVGAGARSGPIDPIAYASEALRR